MYFNGVFCGTHSEKHQQQKTNSNCTKYQYVDIHNISIHNTKSPNFTQFNAANKKKTFKEYM